MIINFENTVVFYILQNMDIQGFRRSATICSTEKKITCVMCKKSVTQKLCYYLTTKPNEQVNVYKFKNVLDSCLLFCVYRCDLTINTAMAPPMMKPAMTSDQWLRYSTTRLIPVRKARHTSPRESTGLASRVPLAFTEHVMYI